MPAWKARVIAAVKSDLFLVTATIALGLGVLFWRVIFRAEALSILGLLATVVCAVFIGPRRYR